MCPCVCSVSIHSRAWQPSTAQPLPAQPGTAQHSTAQHSTAQHSTAQRSAAHLEVLDTQQVEDHGVGEAELALQLGGLACHHLPYIAFIRHLPHTHSTDIVAVAAHVHSKPQTV